MEIIIINDIVWLKTQIEFYGFLMVDVVQFYATSRLKCFIGKSEDKL